MVAPRSSAGDDLAARLLKLRLDRARQALAGGATRPQGIRGQTGYTPLAPNPDQSTLGGVGSQFVYGANSRLADLWSAPMRLAEAAVSPIFDLLPEGSGASQRHAPTPIENFLREGEAVQPAGAAEEVAHRIGEEVGAALPLAGLPYVAGAALPAARPALSTGRRVVDTILNSVRQAPAATAATEAAATLGSGAGAGVAEQIAPGNVGAEMTGQILGGVLPAFMPTRAISRLGMKAYDWATGGGPERLASAEARNSVSQQLANEIGPNARQGLDRATQLRETIPGFKPSAAEATNSPALLATQRDLENQMSGRELERAAMRRRENQQAVQAFADRNAPNAPQGASPEYIIDTATGRITALRDRIAGKQAEIGAIRRQMADTIPQVSNRETGENIRAALEAQRREVSTEMGQLAQRLGINSANVTVPFNQARQELLTVFGQKTVFDDLQNFPNVLTAIKNAPESVTFQDLKALRERLADDIIDANATPFGRNKKIRILRALQVKVDGIIDGLVDNADPGLASSYRQFRDTYRREFVDRFEHGAALRVRQRDGSGYYRTPDEDVAADFFGKGEISGARQFKAIFGTDPSMNASLQGYALDTLRDAAVRDGALDPKLFQTWLRNHAEILREFPNLQRAVTNYDAGLQALGQRQAQLVARDRQITDTVLARELARYSSGTRTPEAVISAALADQKKMAQLVGRLRGTDALDALKRHVWDTVAEGGSEDIRKFLDKNRTSLTWLFGSDHLKNLRVVADAREMIERMPAPRGQGSSMSPFAKAEDAMGMGLPQMSSRLFAVESGRTSLRYAGVDWFSRFLRTQTLRSRDRLWKEALYDPQIAAVMSEMVQKPEPPASLVKRLLGRLFTVAVGNPASGALNTRYLNLGLESRFGGDEERPRR